MKIVNVGKEFYPRLANRDKLQGDSKHTAAEFRDTFLKDLDNKAAWDSGDPYITLDFSEVKKIGPSFANEAFAYFAKYTSPEVIFKKILFTNISNVQRAIIDIELNTGYKKR